MAMKRGTIKVKDIAVEDIDFAIDTALSWDGSFPKLGKGDYIVTIHDHKDEPRYVLVSRRYTSARDHDDAADIALDAIKERNEDAVAYIGDDAFMVYASDKVI